MKWELVVTLLLMQMEFDVFGLSRYFAYKLCLVRLDLRPMQLKS